MSGLRRHTGWLAFAATFAVATAVMVCGQPARAGSQSPPPPSEEDEGLLAEGRQLFLTGCSSCHGADGTGTEQGPSLERSGAAGAYYYLSSGRMPLTDSRAQPQRKRPAYSPGEIQLLVGYVASLGDGPAIPRVRLGRGDLAKGGKLYRANCAPCHSASAIGGALSYGRAAPSLHSADPLQVAAVLRIGPGQMPVFDREALSDDELSSVVRYVRYLRAPATPGGAALGGAGPIPEGFVVWIFGVGVLVLAVLWIGKRQERGGRH